MHTPHSHRLDEKDTVRRNEKLAVAPTCFAVLLPSLFPAYPNALLCCLCVFALTIVSIVLLLLSSGHLIILRHSVPGLFRLFASFPLAPKESHLSRDARHALSCEHALLLPTQEEEIIY